MTHEHKPDPITTERAAEIWSKGRECVVDLTLGEYAYVALIQQATPGSTVAHAFLRILSGEVRYFRSRHAAHYQYTHVPRDVESWHVLGARGAKPPWVPREAEYNHGYQDAVGRQFSVWMLSIPAPIGSVCHRCLGDHHE